ncbi:YqjF family protein [Desertivibrio insolitus]|uniref:YqjF family protein n=1 Tax=Herbiconiux sp. SYSU D00978 TaxID=2812562 RepID=UPI001A97CBA4|nr:DUF2071 domain-containing protein [Herbiconiux sp. SYSU D00978]
MTAEPVQPAAPPLPGRPVIRQHWGDVAFLHWRVDPAEVAPLLPPGTRPDTFDGSSWVGLIPFRLSRSAFLGGPPVPVLGTFPEINVRLYSVDDEGRRGVVFRTLEASRLIPVLTARVLFGLPYRWSRMSQGRRDDEFAYRSRGLGRPGARTHVVVRPTGERVTGDPLAEFLTARWAYHQRHLGRTWYARNVHEPWPLERAELVHLDDTLLEASGVPGLAGRAPDSVLFSSGVDTVFSAPRPMGQRSRFVPGSSTRSQR